MNLVQVNIDKLTFRLLSSTCPEKMSPEENRHNFHSWINGHSKFEEEQIWQLKRKSGRLLKMFKLLVERKDKRRECTVTGYKQYWILLIYTLPTKRESTVKRREVSALKQTHSFERIEIRDTRPSDGEYIVAGGSQHRFHASVLKYFRSMAKR